MYEPLEGTLQAVLIGSMLGDGHLQRVGRQTACFLESHAIDQQDYLKWKASIFGSWTCSVTFIKSKIETHQGVLELRTHSARELYSWWKKFYDRPKVPGRVPKVFPDSIVPMVTPLALAVWYMDDGCAAHWPAISCHERNQRVALNILKEFGIEGTPVLGDSARIEIKGDQNAATFLRIVSPHLVPCILYKNDPGATRLGDKIDVPRLKELLMQGVTTTTLMAEFQVSKSTLLNRMTELGVQNDIRKTNHRETKPDLADKVIRIPTGGAPRLEFPEDLVRDLLTMQTPVVTIAARFGVGMSTLGRYLRAKGLMGRCPRGGAVRMRPDVTYERIKELRDKGLSIKEMCMLLETTKSLISSRMRAYGIL